MAEKRSLSCYKPKWEQDARFCEWINVVGGNKNKFYCKCCEKELSLSMMYEGALKDHAANKSHKEKLDAWREHRRHAAQFFGSAEQQQQRPHPPLAAAANVERYIV